MNFLILSVIFATKIRYSGANYLPVPIIHSKKIKISKFRPCGPFEKKMITIPLTFILCLVVIFSAHYKYKASILNLST